MDVNIIKAEWLSFSSGLFSNAGVIVLYLAAGWDKKLSESIGMINSWAPIIAVFCIMSLAFSNAAGKTKGIKWWLIPACLSIIVLFAMILTALFG